MKNLEKLKQEYSEMLNSSQNVKDVYHCDFDVYDFGKKMLSLIEENPNVDPSSSFKEVKDYMGYDFLMTKVKDPFHFFPMDFDNQTIGGILTGMFEITYK